MKKILVVDDEPDLRFILRKILEREGYAVIEAENGEKALELLKNDKPDLILLDIMMPGLDGWETAKRIKSNSENRDIKIAMLTAKVQDEDKVKSLEEANVEWHITKPVDKAKLLSTVKWLLEFQPKR